MIVILVHIHVKKAMIEKFIKITEENAGKSKQEVGIAQFDIIQNIDDPSKFILIEAYRSSEAPSLHKQTEHYKYWRDAVEEMMEEPRQGVKYLSVG